MMPCVTVALAGPVTAGAEFAHVLVLNTGRPLASELKAPGLKYGLPRSVPIRW